MTSRPSRPDRPGARRKAVAAGVAPELGLGGHDGDAAGRHPTVSDAGDASDPALFAALTLAILPMLVVYTIFQRQIQSGLTAGALK